MLRLIFRRLVVGLLVALTVMTLAFLLTRLSGDLAISIAGPQATQADIDIVRKAYGLDRPLYVQFFAWAGHAMIGDFGQSYFFKDSVANLIGRRLPITLTLGLVGLSLALIVSIPLGILAAVRENSWIDRGVTLFTMVGQAVPSFWLALILMIVLGLRLGLAADLRHRNLAAFRDAAVSCSAFTAIPALTRLTRSGMIEAMASDYIRTARAKGLSRGRIIFRARAAQRRDPGGRRSPPSSSASCWAARSSSKRCLRCMASAISAGRASPRTIFRWCRRWCWCCRRSISASPCSPTSSMHCSIRGCGPDERADCHSGTADRRVSASRALRSGSPIVAAVVVIALIGNDLVPQDPFVQDLGNRLKPPFWMEGSQAAHLLGTDQLGRDYLARLFYGARISLLIGIMTVITSGSIGITLGVLGGFFGGRIDDAVLFTITTRLSIPVVLVALAVVGLRGSGLGLVVATLGLLLWDRFAVVARATTMQIRNLDYVNAARCAGASTPHLLIREILPNIASHLAVVATLEMALAILLEAALSFLGLGVPPPLPSWGLMIAEGKDYMFFSPWVIVVPGAALFILVLGINLVGDGLRNLLGSERLR